MPCRRGHNAALDGICKIFRRCLWFPPARAHTLESRNRHERNKIPLRDDELIRVNDVDPEWANSLLWGILQVLRNDAVGMPSQCSSQDMTSLGSGSLSPPAPASQADSGTSLSGMASRIW